MTAPEVLAELSHRGVRLRLALEFSPRDRVDAPLRAEMARHREELIQQVALGREQDHAFSGSNDDLDRETGWW